MWDPAVPFPDSARHSLRKLQLLPQARPSFLQDSPGHVPSPSKVPRSFQAVPQPFLECTFPKIHKFIPGKTQKSGFTTHKPVQTFPTSLSLPGRTENLPGSGPIVSIPFFSWGVSADLSCLPRNRTQTSPTRMFCDFHSNKQTRFQLGISGSALERFCCCCIPSPGWIPASCSRVGHSAPEGCSGSGSGASPAIVPRDFAPSPSSAELISHKCWEDRDF